MNAIKQIYDDKRNNLYLVKNETRKDDYVNVDGKTMTKHELNEKMAYFYNNGGPVMDI